MPPAGEVANRGKWGQIDTVDSARLNVPDGASGNPRFGEALLLTGAPAPATIRAGEVLTVPLSWQSISDAVPGDLSFSAKLLGPWDSQPEQGILSHESDLALTLLGKSVGDSVQIEGKPFDHCLARIPKAGETRGNLAAGGRGVAQPLSKRDREIAETLGPELVRAGILFAGLDIIGDYLTEVNVTSHTCIVEIAEQTGRNAAVDLLDALER